MPHTHRSFHPQGIADTLWKRARWARQDRIDKKYAPFPEKVKKSEKVFKPVALYIAAAVSTFLKEKEKADAKRSGRSTRDSHNMQRRFNRQR